jgi:hypothetical protein
MLCVIANFTVREPIIIGNAGTGINAYFLHQYESPILAIIVDGKF